MNAIKTRSSSSPPRLPDLQHRKPSPNTHQHIQHGLGKSHTKSGEYRLNSTGSPAVTVCSSGFCSCAENPVQRSPEVSASKISGKCFLLELIHVSSHSKSPFRTSKTANKLKVLPSTSTPIEPIDEEEDSEDDEDAAEGTKRSTKAAALNGQNEPEVEVSAV